MAHLSKRMTAGGKKTRPKWALWLAAFSAATMTRISSRCITNSRGIVEQTLHRVIGEDRAVIVNTYNTLEDAQKDKAGIEAPDMQAGHEQMGVKSMDIWIAERRVAL